MSLRVLLILSAATWLVLGELGAQLAQLQAPGFEAGGPEDLAPLAPGEADDRAADLFSAWRTSGSVATASLVAYTLVDSLFIVLYAVLLSRLFRALRGARPAALRATSLSRAAERWRLWVALLVGADVLENAIRLAMFLSDTPDVWLAWPAWFFTLAKLLFVLLVVVLLAGLLRDALTPRSARAALGDPCWAARQLRVPLVLAGAWCGFLLLDPTGQSADLLRRWLDGWDRLPFVLATLAGAALLGLAGWTSARRLVLASDDTHAWVPSPRLLIGAAVAIGALSVGLRALFGVDNPGAVAIVLGVLAALDLLPGRAPDQAWQRAATATRKDLAEEPSAERAAAVRTLARGLAAAPLVSLGVAVASAMAAPPIVLLFGPEDDVLRALAAAVLAVVAVAGAALVAHSLPARLAALDERAPTPERPRRRIAVGRRSVTVLPKNLERRQLWLGAVALAACVLAVALPFHVPPQIGAVAVAAFAFTVYIVALVEAQHFGDLHPPTPGLAALGFRRLPVTFLLLATFLLASALFNDDDFHAVSRNGEVAPKREGLPIVEAWKNWKGRNCVAGLDADDRVPLVLVASYGGGARAAYWTAAVMTELMGMPARDVELGCSETTALDRVFAASGISGGSLGLASYVASQAEQDERWYEEALGRSDFLGAPTAWALLVDLPRTLLGLNVPDRAQRLEQSWERANEALGDDFFADQGRGLPLLMLSGTQVENGCRLNVSAVRLSPLRESDQRPACAGLQEHDGRELIEDPSIRYEAPSAPLTSDVLDYLCDGNSVDYSSAALLSARFPYVSPSGRLQCDRDDDEREEVSRVVDGGYAEGSGAQPLLDLWERLEPLVEAHNRGSGAIVVPVFVQIDNHYTQVAKSTPVARTGELLVPPVTRGRPDKLDDRGVEQRARALFSIGIDGPRAGSCRLGDGGPTPYARVAPRRSAGLPAPLAWTLSKMATGDLDAQLADLLEGDTASDPARRRIRALGNVLRGEEDIVCAQPETGSP